MRLIAISIPILVGSLLFHSHAMQTNSHEAREVHARIILDPSIREEAYVAMQKAFGYIPSDMLEQHQPLSWNERSVLIAPIVERPRSAWCVRCCLACDNCCSSCRKACEQRYDGCDDWADDKCVICENSCCCRCCSCDRQMRQRWRTGACWSGSLMCGNAAILGCIVFAHVVLHA